jgi:hypothetical protein
MAISLSNDMSIHHQRNIFAKRHVVLHLRRYFATTVITCQLQIELRSKFTYELCDFCNAELQLLMRHRNYVEAYRLVEMPGQLRILAEDLLTRSIIQFAPAGANRNSH